MCVREIQESEGGWDKNDSTGIKFSKNKLKYYKKLVSTCKERKKYFEGQDNT